MTFRADLHAHTTCSDGTCTPHELLMLAKNIGLSAIAITDHDTVEAYATAIPLAKEIGILLGVGVEFSCHHKEKSVHVLGYNFDWKSAEIGDLCARHQIRRRGRNHAILEKLEKLGRPLSEEDLLRVKTPGRPHIAQLMMERGYVSSVREAFQRFLGDDRCCYVSGAQFSLEETLSILHRAGGKVFLAHPHLMDDGRFVKEFLSLPFDGIECYYGTQKLDKEKRWLKIAKDRNLLISGGSDFHGAIKPNIPLGCSWVDEESYLKIFG